MVKDKKNRKEKEIAKAIHIADTAVGAENRYSGASPGSTEKSVRGIQRFRRDDSNACMDD